MASLKLPQQIKAVLFDIDGTLMHSDGLHLQVFQAFFLQHGYGGGVPITEEFFKTRISGRHNPDIFAEFFPDRSEADQLRLSEEKEALFREQAPALLVPLPGLLDFAQLLTARGVAVCAVTNAPRENAELMIRCCGLDAFFGHGERLVIGSECERAKPHPEPYLEGLRRLGVSAADAIAFEDSPSGLRAAVAAGIATVGLTTSQTPEALLAVGAAGIIADYRDAALWAAFGEAAPPVKGV